MRFISLATFLFCVHVSMAIMNASGVFVTTVQPNDSWLGDFTEDNLGDEAYVQNQVDTNVGYDLGDIVKGVFYFVLVFGASVIVLPFTFVQFGMPWGFAILLSIPMYFIYALAWAQFIANRSTKSMT